MTTAALLREAKKAGGPPSRRSLKTTKLKKPKKKKKPAKGPASGDDPGFTEKDLAKGVKPAGVMWGVWGPALKAYQKGGSYSLFGKSKKPKKLRIPADVIDEIGQWIETSGITDKSLRDSLAYAVSKGALPKAKAWSKTLEYAKTLTKQGVAFYKKKAKKSPLPHLSPSYRKKHKYDGYKLRIGKHAVSRWKQRWGDPTDEDNIYNALVSLVKGGDKGIPQFVHDASVANAKGKTLSRATGITVPGGKLSSVGGHSPGKKHDDWGSKASSWPSYGGSKSMGSSWGKGTKPSPKTAEERRLDKIVKHMGSLDRMAAGGVVFKTFEGDDVWNLSVLVCKTAAKYGGTWVFPKGGLDPGESLKQGAVREVREEAGVKSKVADSHAFKVKSKFWDLRKYDIYTVMQAALKAARTPEDKKFVEDQKQLLCRKGYQWHNETHYFVMKWTGGEPNTSHVEHGKPECTNKNPTAEMQDAKWVPLSHAATLSVRMGEVVRVLLRTITNLWTPPPGVKKTKPKKLSALRTPKVTPKPKQINPHNPKPSTGKPHKPPQTHLPWAGL